MIKREASTIILMTLNSYFKAGDLQFPWLSFTSFRNQTLRCFWDPQLYGDCRNGLVLGVSSWHTRMKLKNSSRRSHVTPRKWPLSWRSQCGRTCPTEGNLPIPSRTVGYDQMLAMVGLSYSAYACTIYISVTLIYSTCSSTVCSQHGDRHDLIGADRWLEESL